MERFRGVLEIRLSALKHNFHLLKNLCAKNLFFCPMVKDNGYGHGAEKVVQALLESGAERAGVLTLEEAERILKAGLKTQILIFGPVLNKSAWARIAQKKRFYLPVISNFQDLEAAAALKTRLNIHLKFDLGFSRLGFDLKDKDKIQAFLKKHPRLQPLGICSQPPQKERIAQSETLKNLQALKQFFSCPVMHCLNTEALISVFSAQGRQTTCGARPGIGLYGVKSPAAVKNLEEKKRWRGLDLQNVSTLKGFIVHVRRLEKGGRVSYAGDWRAKRNSVIAAVSLGYADGIPFRWSNRAVVLYRGQKTAVAGRVTMDFFMIDITDQALQGRRPVVGEEVILFGGSGAGALSPLSQAERGGGIPHALFVGLGQRIQRVYFS